MEKKELENVIGQSVKEIKELAIIPLDDGNVLTGVKIDLVKMKEILRSNFEDLLTTPSVRGEDFTLSEWSYIRHAVADKNIIMGHSFVNGILNKIDSRLSPQTTEGESK